MSSIVDGVKKVFKKTVDVVKKYWKPIVGVGLGLLTAGVATAGFGAFQGVQSVGQFFGAAGKTMAIGGQAAMGSLGLTSGVSQGMAQGVSGLQAGTTLGSGVWADAIKGSLGGGGGSSSVPMGMRTLGQHSEALAQSYSGSGGGGNFLTGMGNMMKGFAGNDVGKLMIAQGIMGGISNYMQAKEQERQEKRKDTESVWGAQRRGGGPNQGLLDMPEFKDPEQAPPTIPTPSDWREMAGPMNIDQSPENMPQYNQPMPNQQNQQQQGQGGLLAQYQQRMGNMGMPQFMNPMNPYAQNQPNYV